MTYKTTLEQALDRATSHAPDVFLAPVRRVFTHELHDLGLLAPDPPRPTVEEVILKASLYPAYTGAARIANALAEHGYLTPDAPREQP